MTYLKTFLQQKTNLITTSDEHMKKVMTRKGYDILQRLYSTDKTTGNSNTIGSLMKEMGDLYLEMSQYEVNFKPHNSELPSIVNNVLDNFSVLNIIGDSKPEDLPRNNYLVALGCVVWALHDMAEKDGNDFERGSFKLVDPAHRLKDFLMGYVQFSTNCDKPGFTRFSGANEFAYSRDPSQGLSSHYKDKKYRSVQYGIDARFESNGDLVDIFPDDRAHLLFGSVDIHEQQYTFLKIERIGLGNLKEYVEHGSHYIAPSIATDKDRRETVIPESIALGFQVFLDKMKEVEPKHPSLAQKHWEVYEMHEVVQANINLSSELLTAAMPFISALRAYNFEKDAHIRTGNEVILDMNQLPKAKYNDKPLLFSNRKQMTSPKFQQLDEQLNLISVRKAAPAA